MQDKIVKLPHELVLKIAAGEVVDRPASVVKELVENSIDAGASSITIEIIDGGIKSIRVVDNGKGIKENMLVLAFESHSTSKILDENDLFNISTLGFRGEALASIAAVSKINLITKHPTDKFGNSITNKGGIIEEIKPVSYAGGTSITVKDLFFNTPARLKFLKKPSIEASAITDLLMRLILSKPNISFRYINNGKIIYHSIGDGNLSSAIARVYNNFTAKAMKKVDYISQGVIVSGYLGVMDQERGNRQNQSFFINGRYFKSELISNALEYACRGYVTISKFPSCVLNINIPFNKVDVNVHPNKLEVRFENPDIIKNVIIEAIQSSLINTTILNAFNAQEDIKNKTNIKEEIANSIEEIKTTDNNLNTLISKLSNEKIINNDTDNSEILRDSSAYISESTTKWSPSNSIKENRKNIVRNNFIQEQLIDLENLEDSIKVLGTLFDTFIVVEYKNKCLIIDQHAAQERINFDRMMLLYKSKELVQPYITPLLITVDPRQAESIRERMSKLFDAGFDIGFFDESSIVIRSAPMLLGEPMMIKDCIIEILNDWDKKSDSYAVERTTEKILQSACKYSIKAGDKLSNEAAFILVKQMLDNNITPTCPHGRPIVIEITKNELYKRFKRV